MGHANAVPPFGQSAGCGLIQHNEGSDRKNALLRRAAFCRALMRTLMRTPMAMIMTRIMMRKSQP